MPEGRRVESNSRESHLSCQHDVKRSLMPEGCMLTNGWWFQQGLQVLTQSYIRLWIFFSQIRPWRSLDFCMRCLQIVHRSSPLAAGPLESLYLPGHTIENTIKKKQRTLTTTLHKFYSGGCPAWPTYGTSSLRGQSWTAQLHAVSFWQYSSFHSCEVWGQVGSYAELVYPHQQHTTWTVLGCSQGNTVTYLWGLMYSATAYPWLEIGGSWGDGYLCPTTYWLLCHH